MKIFKPIKVLLIIGLLMFFNNWLRTGSRYDYQIIFLILGIFILFLLLASWGSFLIQNPKTTIVPKAVETFLVLLYAALTVYQIKSTDIKNAYEYTPVQIDTQIKRMRYYPVKLTKLGYYLENKKETLILYKYEENFFSMLDINEYFPDYFSLVLLPFTLIGLYQFTIFKQKLIKVLFIISLFIISILGVNGLAGPVLLFPFINLFAFLGVVKILQFKK
ncbi:MAG TPA: hypothetical protein VI819_02260 [Patescibacteria group bacterium]|nr:hypothetical protein [Patescibacteria group bacterium]